MFAAVTLTPRTDVIGRMTTPVNRKDEIVTPVSKHWSSTVNHPGSVGRAPTLENIGIKGICLQSSGRALSLSVGTVTLYENISWLNMERLQSKKQTKFRQLSKVIREKNSSGETPDPA